MEETKRILLACPLFSGYDGEKLPSLLKRCGAQVKAFSSGDTVPTEEKGLGILGILLRGELSVRGEKASLLNRLSPGALFGVSHFCGSAGADTKITCEKASEVLWIRQDAAEPLWEDRVIRNNLLSFLTDRICFLNEKIASLTAGDAEEKLIHFLSKSADDKGIVTLKISYSDLANSLGIGRASLYRAMDILEEKSIIRREKKTIEIISPKSIGLIW